MALKINVTWPVPLPQLSVEFAGDGTTIIDRGRATPEGHEGRDIVIDDAFGPGNRVFDEDRYRIDHNSQSPLQHCDPCAPFERTLVIVLESPHESEYRNNRIDQPLGPAKGRTGDNIRDYLMCVIRSCDHLRLRIRHITRVIVVNPIQFQCSLASIMKQERKSWRKTRDLVWRALWSQQSIRDDFRNRLESYNADFIINACTHDVGCNPRCPGGDPECRKQKVHDFLAERFSAHIYDVAHPSAWTIRKKRRLHPIRWRPQVQIVNAGPAHSSAC